MHGGLLPACPILLNGLLCTMKNKIWHWLSILILKSDIFHFYLICECSKNDEKMLYEYQIESYGVILNILFAKLIVS